MNVWIGSIHKIHNVIPIMHFGILQKFSFSKFSNNVRIYRAKFKSRRYSSVDRFLFNSIIPCSSMAEVGNLSAFIVFPYCFSVAPDWCPNKGLPKTIVNLFFFAKLLRQLIDCSIMLKRYSNGCQISAIYRLTSREIKNL